MVEAANDELERTLKELAASAKTGPRSGGQPSDYINAPAAPPASEPEAVAAPAGIDALRETSLELWYQPKIDLRLKCLAGAEALARIHHPQHGLIGSDSIIANVDGENLAKLTEHALLTALNDWEQFDAAGFNLRLAINLPVDHLLKLPIARLVDESRPRASHWPGLIVEVSEDQIVRDLKAAQEIAMELKEAGIAVSIEDVGAGFSSFATLRDLAFAELKLDESFVKGCALDSTNAAICQTVIDLAHRFGSTAVGEGIETIADLSALQIMDCDFGQGVLLAPAMPRDRFISLLRQRMNRPAPQQAPAAAAATVPTAAAG
jgi:EAL domain-containing protein (putative c-di-GMP-specific phosphodiesterase class I)